MKVGQGTLEKPADTNIISRSLIYFFLPFALPDDTISEFLHFYVVLLFLTSSVFLWEKSSVSLLKLNPAVFYWDVLFAAWWPRVINVMRNFATKDLSIAPPVHLHV